MIPKESLPKYKVGDRVHVVKTPVLTDNFNCPPIIKGKINKVIIPVWGTIIIYRVEFDSPLTSNIMVVKNDSMYFKEWEIYPLETRGKLT